MACSTVPAARHLFELVVGRTNGCSHASSTFDDACTKNPCDNHASPGAATQSKMETKNQKRAELKSATADDPFKIALFAE